MIKKVTHATVEALVLPCTDSSVAVQILDNTKPRVLGPAAQTELCRKRFVPRLDMQPNFEWHLSRLGSQSASNLLWKRHMHRDNRTSLLSDTPAKSISGWRLWALRELDIFVLATAQNAYLLECSQCSKHPEAD